MENTENVKYDMANSLSMQCLAMGDKLVKANHILAHACIGKKSKDDMVKAIKEADELIYEVRQYLIGR